VTVFVSAEGIDTPLALQLYERLLRDARLTVFHPSTPIPRTPPAGSIILWCISSNSESRRRLHERSAFEGSPAIGAQVSFDLDHMESSLKELYEEYLFPPDLENELNGH
jgi:hypothetical protein